MNLAIERQVIATWYTPQEKLPPEDNHVLVTVSGSDKNTIYDHALQIGSWMDDGLGWLVEGFSDEAEVIVHAWCDIDPYGFKEDAYGYCKGKAGV